jgi:exodeoxyribonuclease V alpha subunit
MNKYTDEQPTTMLQGVIERINFHSEQTGFCVLRVMVKGSSDVITIVGQVTTINVGDHIECQGHWVNDKKHGLQFKTIYLHVIPPTTIDGIEKYLSSGMVKGIGPHFAKKLVTAFGEAVFDIIDKEPERLMTLEGIGKKRKETVIAAWAEQKVVRNIMIFLQTYGVSATRAVRIYKTYGNNAIDTVRTNPYRLALDIRGIGFKTADTIAEHLGIAKDSMIRAEAGVRHVLQQLCNSGHCAAFYDQLVETSHQLLAIPKTIIKDAIANELMAANLVHDTILGQSCIYPMSLYQAESQAAELLKALKEGLPSWGEINIIKAIPWVEQETKRSLSVSQQQALATVLTSKLTVITGGPGVGKTTLVNSLLRIIDVSLCDVALCAPTGRAAKRLTETTNLPAKTIHRLLDFDPRTYGFKHNADNLLPIDVIIIDESSMIDITLLYQLLIAIPLHASVVFVGDIDQLPSVGSGSVLADLIASNVITTVRLTEIFRQATSSNIITNAHSINQGNMPLPNTGNESDFYTIYTETPEEIFDTLIDVVCKRLPKFYQCNPIKDIQVLTPMHNGNLGSRNLNTALQQHLNDNHLSPRITHFGVHFTSGDKVIQMSNNYQKGVFNGDIGFIDTIDLEEGVVSICFEQSYIKYDINELDEISLAYAISIHKSQGSEFPIVIIPLGMQHFSLLARNLLYTGITRGKQLVILIGQKKAVSIAVKNNREANRLTKLAQRLLETPRDT